ncbi:MAG: UDP-glucose/GDP-mannose dehydrogenase family protein [Caulobacteraceae bacterium]
MKLLVVGSGYVGLVSGACFAELGNEVVCIDRDRAKIDGLRAGVVPIYEPGLEDMIAGNVKAGRLRFDTTMSGLDDQSVDAVFIAVGTPPRAGDQGADLSSVFAVAAEIAERASGRLIVVTKSTVPVGTGDAIEKIIRARAPALGLSVVSNPEFLREGEAIVDFMAPDRIVVGAEDDLGRETLERLYAPLTERGAALLSMRRRGAELVKYASNAFLVTKISFINEIADLCEAVDADIGEVARGVGMDRRIGAAFLTAGPGYGGSCFPKDCAALLGTAQDHAVDLRIVESAINANHARKRVMARRVINAMGGSVQGARIAVLGLTFKANTDDMRDAPSIAIVESLRQGGAAVKVYDPRGMPQAKALLGGVEYCPSATSCCAGADCIILATEWPEFLSLDFHALAKAARGRVFVDLRNLIDVERLLQAGFTAHGIGRRSRAPGLAALAAANTEPANGERLAKPRALAL